MAAAPATRERRTRLTYLLLFRVVVVSLLLAVRLFEELTAPEGASIGFTAGLGLVVLSYFSSIGFSLWLGRTTTDTGIDRVAVAQIVFDLLASTAVVHITGGIESQLTFTYLLVVGGAGLLFTRGAVATAGAAVALYAGLLLLRHFGVLPHTAQLMIAPPRELARAISFNGVAILATGVLALRFAIENARTSESLVRSREEIEDLHARYADVVQSLSSGLITLGIDGRVATVNHAGLSVLGRKEHEVVGRLIDDLIAGTGELLEPRRNVQREELAFVDAEGKTRRLGLTLSPLVDAKNVQVGQIVTFQDLTDLRAMEEAVTRQKRLAAIGRLAAGVAHEIRNPLAAISGSIELLVASGAGEVSEDAKELSQIVLREVSRLNTLITELLDFARPREMEIQRLDLSDAVRELVQVFQHDKTLGTTRVELTAEHPVFVSADPGQLRQVVWNLLRNAAEAAPEQLIHVVVDDDHNGYARLVVRDEGPGISDDQLSRVFEPFFSTKTGGTGLGLPMVHRIVEEHHGTVELRRLDEGGTAAVVKLPRVA